MANLFATKPLSAIIAEAGEEGTHTLKRSLNLLNLITLGVGTVIGAGIFVLTGVVAAQFAGPAIVLSFLLAAIACAFTGLCYSEFAALIPVAGSAYTYGYATLGELFAWIIGWNLILEYAFGAALVANGGSGYIVSFLQDLDVHIPPRWTATPGTELVQYHGRWELLDKILPTLQQAGVDPATLPHVHAVFNLIAALAICAITALLILGVKKSANFNSAIVMLKIAIVLVFVGIAFVFLGKHPSIAWANWHPFLPPNTGEFGKYGWSGVLRGAGVIFNAYIGFDCVSTAAQEANDPQKDMPRGILGTLGICTLLYILVAGLLTALVNFKFLNISDPVAVGIDATGVHWGGFAIKLGAAIGLSSVLLGVLLGQSRVFFSMSRDGLLPKCFGRVHPKYRTPYISSIVIGVCVVVLAGLLPIGLLAELISIGTLLAFAIVCAGVWVLRIKHPDLKRPFRTPWVPLVPFLGIAVTGGLMLSLPGKTWLRLLIWSALGLLVYFFYGRKHSRVQLALAAAASEVAPTEGHSLPSRHE